MIKINELGIKKPKYLKTYYLIFILIAFISSNLSASSFHEARKNAALRRWKKEMKSSYPPKEVILTTRYFIRDVIAKNQQFVMTNEGVYWDAIRARYGGKKAHFEDEPLEHLYDFNWYIFHELKKYREATVSNFKKFFGDYISIVDLFCKNLNTTDIINHFFETYYTNWLISATYQREKLPRLKPILQQAISDLPENLRGIGFTLDSLEKLIPEPQKNFKKIDLIVKKANSKYLRNNKYYLTINFFSGKKLSALINAFKIEDDFQYPVKLDQKTIKLNVLKLTCVDNLSHTISVPGYYYKKKVFIFPNNQIYKWNDFSEYFKGNKSFPFLDLFVCDTTIQSYFDNGMVTKSSFNELMTYHSWLKTGDGKIFLKEIEKLAKPPTALKYSEWIEKTEISLLHHEVVGHGGTFSNGIIEEPKIPTFDYHVEAEFFAYLLQYIYSQILGFDLACMLSQMSNPVTFSHQYGDAYLRICRETLKTINEEKVLSKQFKDWSNRTNAPNLKTVTRNSKKFESLNYQVRIKMCLLPLVTFLNEFNQEEKRKIFLQIYFRNSEKPIPAPVISGVVK